MIDIENKVIDTVTNAFDGIADVSSVFIESPEKFPWIYIRELSNTGYARSYDNSLTEHHVRVSYRIEYYATGKGAKQKVKELMQIGDTCMQGMKLRRTAYSLIPNWDRSVIRAYADYSAIVGEPKEVDGNTVYQMYR